ncbi:KxYKxGKxW signal peptide domain-containing protein [Limosilactobacillus vaginalis]|uniref:KxYKxGKxW signal peptide domain-containing protein n=1 Tax=Limosilactobacillus vaginalis TaxID=1633 RepID=UPI003F23AED9
MELKKHYKMYKSGKMWVSAAVATLALTAGMAVSTNVSADESTNGNQAQATTNQNVNSSSNEVNLNQTSSSTAASAQPADNQDSNAGKADDQNNQSTEVKTATVTRNITFTAVDDQGKEVSLPNGAKSKDQQNVTISTDKNGKWQSNNMPEYQIPQIDGYYTKVNGKWETTIPAVSITDPNQKNLDVTVQYVKSTRVVKPTDEKDKDQANQFGTVTDTVKYEVPNGVPLPDGANNPDTIKIKVSRDKTIDSKTNEVTYGNWTGKLAKDYQIPKIAGYTSYVNGKAATVIKADSFTIDSKSKDVPKGQTITITYQVSEDYNKNVDQKIQGNWGWIDSLTVENNSVHVKGWNATNTSREGQYHYIFVMDGTTGQELRRVAVDLASDSAKRADIPGVHNVWNAARSGFDVTIPLNTDNLQVGHKIIVMSRWTSDKDGNTPNKSVSADLYFDGRTNDANNVTYVINQGQNLANLDTFKMNGSNGISVAGWHATNESLNYKNHWLILWDATTGREISRQQVKGGDDGVDRPDVANVYKTTFNADKSGFNTYFSLKGVTLTDRIQLVSRYTNDVNGNGPSFDYWFPAKQFMTANAASAASLDDISYTGNGLHVSGWFATDNIDAMPNLFLILWDNTGNTQAASKLVNNVARPDVARAYSHIKNAGNSGFDTYFNGISLVPGHQYTLVARYSSNNTGNGGNGAYTNVWFTNKKYTFNLNRTNAGNFDGYTINDGKLVVSGWHANDMSALENNHWLILLDSSNGNREVQRIQVNNIARPDVANAYRGVMTAGNSGFNGQFDLSKLQAGHMYTLVSRYAVDPNNAAQYTDYWFNNAFTLNKQAYNVDSFTPIMSKTTDKDDKESTNTSQITGFHVTGWMASDYSLSQPNAYLILVNDKGQELARQNVELVARPDVEKAYPAIANSGKSGFSADLKLDKGVTIDSKTNESLHLVLRYTNGKDGNPTKTDQVADQNSNAYTIKDGQLEK